MTTLAERLPAPEDLDTPWEPQEIIWRDLEATEHNRQWALRKACARATGTHIVREVQYSTNRSDTITGPGPVTADICNEATIKDILERADEQFDHLETYGISVPKHQWYFFRDPEGIMRVISRVAIIDPYFDSVMRLNMLQRAGAEAIEGYVWQDPPPPEEGMVRLSDLDSDQCIVGVPRPTPDDEPAPFMVDIEPRMYSSRHFANIFHAVRKNADKMRTN